VRVCGVCGCVMRGAKDVQSSHYSNDNMSNYKYKKKSDNDNIKSNSNGNNNDNGVC
jgi:hypothetical protein